MKKTGLAKVLPWMLVIGGAIGLVCALVLSVDEVDALKNPNFKPACNLNPIISCGSVMNTHQASVFGISNPFIGIATFAILITVGVALLAGGTFKRWFWLGLNLGAAGGIAFAYWLLFESIYRIHALCPFCLSVDVVVTTLFWYITLYNLQEKHLVLPPKFKVVGEFAQRHHLDILLAWFVLVIIVILNHFWYYYGPGLSSLF